MSAIWSSLQGRPRGKSKARLVSLAVALTAILTLSLAGVANAETYQSQKNTSLYIVQFSNTRNLGTNSGSYTSTGWTPIDQDSNGYVLLRNNYYTSDCMNVSGSGTANGTQIIGYTCSASSTNEYWHGYYANGTQFWLATELTGIGAAYNCASDSSTSSGNTSLVLETCTSSTADLWH